MPWQIDGTFLRVTNNTTEQGTDKLWQQDLESSIKIIATRHDFHDHDLAGGIERCMNIDGYNQMYANLNLGGYKITNLADASLLDDVPKYGQIAGALDWEFDTANTLRLLSNDGNVIDTVVIPTAGGSGTVTSITAGAGLEGGTITLAGTISLPVLGVGQSYSGGISQIAIDDYGRVTSVTEGAFANTNLGNTPAGSSVEITSSTGSPTTLAAAIPNGNAGVMTGLMAKQLADLVSAGIGGGMIPPIELIGVNDTPQVNLIDSVAPYCDVTVESAPADSAVWGGGFTYNGSGLIEFMGFRNNGLTAGWLLDIRVVIDGVVVWTVNDVFSDANIGDSFCVIGGTVVGQEFPDLQQVKFNDSLQVELRDNVSPSTASCEMYLKWQKQT